jgi:hypothetical protein
MPRVPVVPTQQLNPQGPAQYSAPGVVPVQDQFPRQSIAMGEAAQQAGLQFARLDYRQRMEAEQQAEAEAREAEKRAEYAAGIQRRQDIAETEEQFNKVAEDDGNEFAKYSTLQGRAAVDAFEAFDQSQQQRYRVALERAKNETQRQWLKEKLGDRRVQIIGRARAHKEGQLAVQRYGVAQQSTKQAVDDVVKLGPSEQNLQAVRDRATEQAQLAGVDPEPVAKLAMQDAHLGYLDKLLEEGRTGEAVKWLAEHEKEIDREPLAKVKKQVRAQEIGDFARLLDQSVDSIEDRLKEFDKAEANGLPRKEADLGRQHIFALENQRDARNAEIAQEVEIEARRWMQSTGLPVEANPDLAERVATYGVTLKRVTNQRALDAFYAAPPAELDRLRSLTPPQLHRELATFLDEHDEGTVTKFLRGDQTGARIDDLTKILARQIGILPGTEDGNASTEQTRKFDLWKVNTIAPIIKAESDRLKRPLNADEFQKLIVNPILNDKVWNEVWGRDQPVPLMQLQMQREAPVDDPMTPQDESMDYDAYGGLYVKVEGKEVRLRDIPLEARKSIRDKWAKKNPGVWLSAAEEAATWLEMKAEADKANPPKQPKPVVAPANIAPMPDDGAGAWWSGSLNEQEKMRKMAEGMQGNR